MAEEEGGAPLTDSQRPTALDLFSPSALPAIDETMDRMETRLREEAKAGNAIAVADGLVNVERVLERLGYVRRLAGQLAYGLLPVEKYKYRGEERERRSFEVLDDTTLVEPWLAGGGWRKVDYPRAVKAVANAVVGMDSRIIDREGEVRMTVEELVGVLLDCFSFCGLKSNDEKHTGLVAQGFKREDFGTWEEPRHDVRVQRREGT